MSESDADRVFESEARELLDDMEQALLTLEDDPSNFEGINSVFRAAHTIKGSAGLFGYEHVIGFTHRVEGVLDSVRAGELSISPELLSLLLICRDVMGRLVDVAVRGNDGGDDELRQQTREVAAELDVYLQEDAADAGDDDGLAEADDADAGGEWQMASHWQIKLKFGRDVLRMGMDPVSFVRYLGTLGDIAHLTPDWTALPEADEVDPQSCYLALTIDLISNAGEEEIENVFQFILDDCELSIECMDPVGDENSPAEQKPLDVAVAKATVKEPAAAAPQARGPAQNSGPAGAQERETIRVSAEKLGELINLIGELVISNANTKLLGERTQNSELIESMENTSRLVESIRDTGLGLRMVPIGETFNRFRRVVRDLSGSLRKEVDLEISGGDRELDKTVVEKIRDPLMHLVRNAMDHGIESVERRREQGKPAKGKLRLNAYHDSGSIVIEVEDDGAGLSREKILAKAQNLGLVSQDQELSDQEVYRLVFEPGFSTAEEVTDVSGRGVGMDVVRRNISALRGYIDVESWPGQGSRFSIRLPLTLAIIDGFLVGVGKASYVIPLDMVEECVELPADIGTITRDNAYINLRGEVLPFIRLADLFCETRNSDVRENIVVVHSGGKKVGFVVDALLGEYQTVIKPLGKIFRNLIGVSGATILGSGEVATIIDVPALIHRMTSPSGGDLARSSNTEMRTELVH